VLACAAISLDGLAATNEGDDFKLIVGLQLGCGVLRAWHNRTVALHGYGFAT